MFSRLPSGELRCRRWRSLWIARETTAGARPPLSKSWTLRAASRVTAARSGEVHSPSAYVSPNAMSPRKRKRRNALSSRT